MKKFITPIVSLVVAVGLLAGCASTPSNQAVTTTVITIAVADTQSTIIPQYFMFSLTFNFNNFLKPGESLPQNNMRQGGGFGGGGFGGGGNRGGGGGPQDSTD